MGVSGLETDSVAEVIVRGSVDFQVQEAHRIRIEVHVELDVVVDSVEEVVEFVQCVEAVVPQTKNVVYEAKPDARLEVMCECAGLPASHVDVGESPAVGRTHRCSCALKELLALKSEGVVGQQEAQHRQQGQVRTSWIWMQTKSLGNCFKPSLDGNVAVEGGHIHSEEDRVAIEPEVVQKSDEVVRVAQKAGCTLSNRCQKELQQRSTRSRNTFFI